MKNHKLLLASVAIAGIFFTWGASGAWASKVHPRDTSTLALKDFRELYQSLATVTGVDPTSSDVTAYYQQVVGQLPRNGTLSEFNAQTLLAATGLGGVFCSHEISADAQTGTPKTGLNAGVDFTQGPQAIGTTQRTKLIQNYVQAFLQRSPTANEQQTLLGLFAAQTDSTNASSETQNAILAVCSAMAGSIEFLSN